MLQNSTNRLNGQGWGYAQWYHDCLASMRACVVEFRVLKIIRTVAAGRADGIQSSLLIAGLPSELKFWKFEAYTR